MSIQDDETLNLYIEESLEHLSDIENDLLAIEEGGADIDKELVNKVFRAAHSIKGGAGFMGLDKIKGLAHKAENILGMIRSLEVTPNPEITNILLRAFDKLRELINNVGQDSEIDISEDIVALNGIASASLPQEEKESVSKTVDISLQDGTVVFTVTEFDISQAGKNGMFIYLVEYDLIHDVQNKGKTPLDVVREMQDSGNILESKIDFNAVGNLEADVSSLNRLPFLILFTSIIEPDIISDVLGLEEERVRPIGDDLTVKSSGIENSGIETRLEDAEVQRGPETEKFDSPEPVEKVAQTEVTIQEELTHEEIPEKREKAVPEVHKTAVSEKKSPHAGSETSLRVNVSLLDSLMNLAGELVLSRNQLLQTVGSDDQHFLEMVCQKIDMVTSELQEAIVSTRMQPIGNVFNKFPRVVRDLANNLGKEVDLTIEGKEVELDKTIIEVISDPLTHLVRNSVDHGVELPGERIQAGKDKRSNIFLKAFHEAGQVNIEISDDGKGLDGDKIAVTAVTKGLITEDQAEAMSKKEKVNLIFIPGFSTAEKVTDVSGRGVGMDVVKTNLDKLGGLIDIDSHPGTGTRIRIKLPLTLAIIPSQIISNGNERYAISQVNIDELLRIPPEQIRNRIERVGDAEVVRLREQLLPLLNLSHVLGIERTYIDLETGVKEEDCRENTADRRSQVSPVIVADREEQPAVDIESQSPNSKLVTRCLSDRRRQDSEALNIVVVSTGTFTYGLIVDGLHDSEEIVVKPLGRHLKHCKGYAGATIMGDGRVALILDVAGIARMAGLSSLEGHTQAIEGAKETEETLRSREETQSLLVFMNGEEEQFAVPLELVARIEKIKEIDIERLSGKRVIQYRGGTLPLFTIDEVASVNPLEDRENFQVIVFKFSGREVGLLTTGPVDAMEVSVEIDDVTLKQTGIMGSAIIGGRTTLIVDIFEMIDTLNPDWCIERITAQNVDDHKPTILLVEDSNFFRNQVKRFMEDDGYNVIEAEDGMIAWNVLQEHIDDVSVVVTDIEMPNLDGFALTNKIRGDERFSHLPIITLTSLAGEEDIERGKSVGVDDYQIKLDRERLMQSVHDHLEGR